MERFFRSLTLLVFFIQISEDFSYILSDLPDGFSYTISGILGRTIGAVSSHWLYTSFLAMGLVLIWRSRQKLINSKYSLIGILYACGAFAAHLLEIFLFEIQKAICHGHQVFLFHSIFSSSLHFIRNIAGMIQQRAIRVDSPIIP